MPDQISKKVLIEIDIASEQASAAVADFKTKITDLKAALNSNKQAVSDAKAVQAQYTAETAKGKLEQQNIKTAIDQARLAHVQATAATKASKEAYVAAAGSYTEADLKLKALAKSIKNVEGGFKSTDPAIQKQITEYKTLNKELTAFDAKLGNHQRKVGQYENALSGITGQLGGLIPGFNQFSGSLQSVAQKFSAMGTGAEGAETGMAALGAGALEVAGPIAVAALAVGGFLSYMSEFESLGSTLKASKSAIGSYFSELFQQIKEGNWNIQTMQISAGEAAGAAYDLSKVMGELGLQTELASIKTKEENMSIAHQMLLMRDRTTTAEQAGKIFEKVTQTAEGQYARNIKLSQKAFYLTIDSITLGKTFTQEQLDLLKRYGNTQAEIIANLKHGNMDLAKSLVETNVVQRDDLKKITESYAGILETNFSKEEQKQRAQNFYDRKKGKQSSTDNSDVQRQETIKEKIKEINSEQRDAIAKTLEFQQAAFAKELSMLDEKYRQEIFKQEKHIDEAEKIKKDKKASPKTKQLANEQIVAAQKGIVAIKNEQNAELEKLLEDHHKKTIEEVQKSANELAAIQIAEIKDVSERERQAENLSFEEKNQALDREISDRKQNEQKITNEMAKAKPARLKILIDELKNEKNQIDIANAKKLEFERLHKEKILKIDREAANKEKELNASTELLKAQDADRKSPTGKNDKALLDAELKNIEVRKDAELSNETLTAAQKLNINADYESKKEALIKSYNQKRLNDAVKWERQIQSAATTIISNAITSNAQYAEVSLQKQKGFELQNQALTSTQRYEVEEKFRIKSGKAKVKEFEANKKLQLANAIINLMVAEGKLWVDPGFPAAIPLAVELGAQSAIQIAEIASQKAPAYAGGGLHYTSDGRGGVLPGYSRTDNTNAYLRSGEGIVVSEAMQVPWARNLVSAINQSYGGRPFDATVPVKSWLTPGFAAGGLFNTYMPVSDSGLRPQLPSIGNGRMHPDDVSTIINGFSNAVNNMPAPVTDVKDINFQQGRISKVDDRLRY
ncbi:MAG: smc 2 [Mucilaginibacter sp.]|nr:smc 2 [Mucilaginibacter sp.]